MQYMCSLVAISVKYTSVISIKKEEIHEIRHQELCMKAIKIMLTITELLYFSIS